ncbi:YeeE/YedE family protein [Ascidiimonas aurantiaca]|uniref:YeeE/YedE family protein n=1 Tax=Ascidiimonas aurantiaca TaxID=1685432 RepID=UPI0030ECE4DE
MNKIMEPWPWYIAGPLIALVMFLLLMMGNRFGMSSNLRTLCTICGAGKTSSFFRFDWKQQKWNLLVIVGVIIGGGIASFFMTPSPEVAIHQDSIMSLQQMGFESAGKAYLPQKLFADEALLNVNSLLILIAGGFLVGFGTRYAGGCTSGHAISGLSEWQLPSLIAVIGFFIGGLIMVHVLFPLIF